MRICGCFTDLEHVCVRLLSTHTAFAYVCVRILRTLCRFCVRIQLIFCASCAAFSYIYRFLCAFSGFPYVYGLSFAMLNADCLEGSHLVGSLIFLSVQKLVIRCQYQGSDLEGSVELFFRARCSLLLDRIEDPILRVPPSYFSAKSACYYWTISRIRYWGFCRVICPTICLWFTVRSYFGCFFLILIEQYIYPGGVILLWTMLLCGSYKCRYEGYFGCNYDILYQSRISSTSLLLTLSCLQVNTY